MSKTPEEMLTELLAQIAALGRQAEQSADPDVAAAIVAQSLHKLRDSVAAMDGGDDAGAALAGATSALASLGEELKAAGVDGARLAVLEKALASGDVARAMDTETDGAFSRFRADREALAMEAIRRDARANADRSARQIQPDLDFASRLPRPGRGAADTKENAS